MNEIFEFRRHLNTKKVIGIAVLAVLLIIFIINLIFGNSNKDIKERNEDTNPYKIYTSFDEKISIELPKRYNLNEIESNTSLKLQSDDGLLISIEEKTIIMGRTLKDIANIDKDVFISKFENSFDITDLETFNLENSNMLTSYKYSFRYIKQATEYDIQVYWIQDNSQYYIINLCVPQNNASKYQGIESEIISSFKIN